MTLKTRAERRKYICGFKHMKVFLLTFCFSSGVFPPAAVNDFHMTKSAVMET